MLKVNVRSLQCSVSLMDIKTKLLWCLVLLIMRGLCCCCWLSVVIRMTSNSSDSAGFFSSRRSFTLCIAWKVIQEKIERLYLIYSIIILLQSFIVNVCYCWINQNVIVFIKKKELMNLNACIISNWSLRLLANIFQTRWICGFVAFFFFTVD